MPSLSDVLKDTYLRTADPASKPDPALAPHPWFTQAITVPNSPDAGTQRIWGFKLTMPTDKAGPKVTDLTCLARDFDYRAHVVADLVTWGPVKVHVKVGGKLKGDEFPLTKDFILRHWNSTGGSITEEKAESSRLWKLEAQTDVSFETVFGYHWYPEGNPSDDPEKRIVPIPLTVDLESPTFMTDPGDKPAPQVNASGSTVLVKPIRVLIAVSLICCKERKDWEPAKTIGAARLYPLIMVMADTTPDLIETNVIVDRPKQCLNSGMACHPEAPSEVGSVLFTDTNDASGALPTWDNIFDYYQVGVKSGFFKVVRRDRWQDNRVADPNASPPWVENQEGTSVGGGIGVKKFARRVTPHKVVKKGFQGEFDNLHIAPRMVCKAKHKSYVDTSWGIHDVVMAPFCLHDCLHVHWRWGTGGPPAPVSSFHLRGWVGKDKPFAVHGNTLVPANQDVFVDIRNSGSGFRVFTQCYDTKAGEWAVFFHNGLSYGVSIGTFGLLPRTAPEPQPALIDGIVGATPWPEFYWHLRHSGWEPHDGKPAEFFERLKINDLAKLRDL